MNVTRICHRSERAALRCCRATPTSVDAPPSGEGSTSTADAPALLSQITVGDKPLAQAAAALPDFETITFSEFPRGTQITDQYQQRGILFGGDSPFITSDGANPTSPVLSGTPTFQGAIEGTFVNVWGTQRTVDRMVIDVGYIDTPNSVHIMLYDRGGDLLREIPLHAGGIVTVTIIEPGIAKFRVEAVSNEPAGFAIDNVSFPSPGPSQGEAHVYVGACSGARIDDVRDGQWNEDPQLDGLGIDTRLVTIGIVGNDLDFADTMTRCVATALGNTVSVPLTWWRSCARNLGPGVDSRIASLEGGELRDDLLALYREIRSRAAYARVLVITYPEFFPDGGIGGYAGCELIRSSDQEWMNSKIREADAAIVAIAHEAGYEAVDVSEVLDGHEVCTAEPAMNEIVPSSLVSSLHPNVLGHRLIADAIEDHLGRQDVEPTFIIRPGETVTRSYSLWGSAFTLNASWPGSDVVTTLVSPSGVRYTREDPRDAEHANGPTWEYFTIPNPEPGDWTVEAYGADVGEQGEPVTYTTYEAQPPNAVPEVTVTVDGGGRAYTFDASGSVDPDGTITEFTWDFGDGTTATGPLVTHTFPDGAFQVVVAASDDAGGTGFGFVEEILVVGTYLGAGNVYSRQSLSIGNSVTLAGPVIVGGDFVCTNSARVDGDLLVAGDVYLTNDCRIDGGVAAGGTVRMDSASVVTGAVRAGGSVSFQSTATIGAAVDTAGSFTIIDGSTIEALQAAGRLGGPVTTGADITAPDLGPAPKADDQVPETSVAWGQWLREIATAAGAPPWASAFTAAPGGCAIAPWTVGTTDIAVASDTVVDARTPTSGCHGVGLYGLTLHLSGDLTIITDGLQSTNGLTVRSADGQPHRLRVLVPGGSPTGDVTLIGPTITDDLIATEIITHGAVDVHGLAALSGRITAGSLHATGNFALTPAH